jgi:hypothetical protein
MRRSRLPGPQAQRACLFQWVLVSPGLKTSSRAFLHLRFCVLTPRAIKNEYLRNTLDVRDGADELHRSRYLKSVALEALFSPKRLRGSFLSRKRDRPAKLNSMTAAPQSPGRSRAPFDHLVGDGEQRRRNSDTESYSSPHPPTGSNLSAQPNTKPNHTL